MAQVPPIPHDPLLQEREKTHGSFNQNADIWNTLLKAHLKSGALKAEHSLALHMIYVKLSRILSGQADFKDHWADIAGYAKLGEEACEK